MRRRDRRLRRGAYLLPTLFTVGNLFCGFYAIVATLHGRLEWAAILICGAALLDAADGRLARLTGTASEFGREFDSLADALSFGTAPALLVQAWALGRFGRLGWLAAFLFVTCGVARLARFNIQTGGGDRRFFIGLPIPAAAVTLASCVLLRPDGLELPWLEVGALVFTLVLAALMVSRLRFRSFKDLDLKNRLPSVAVVVVALAFAGATLHPRVVLFLLALLYVLSGLLPRRRPQRADPRLGATLLPTPEVDHGKGGR